MKRGWLGVALLLSIGFNLGLIGMQLVRERAVERWERGERWSERDIGERLARRLELAGEERERFLVLQRRLGRSVLEARQRVHALRRELRDELIAPEPDRGRIDRLLTEIAAEQSAIDRAFTANVLESRAALGEEAERAYLRFVERFAGAIDPGHGLAPRRPGGGRGGAPPRDRPDEPPARGEAAGPPP